MKILVINKKFIVNIIFVLFMIILSTAIFELTSKVFESTQTIHPLNIIENTEYDLTGDGKEDTIKIVNGQNKIDYNIKAHDDDYYLSKKLPDKLLFNTNTHWKPTVFIHDISRDKIPEIILHGSKNNKSICYIFHWEDKDFSLVSSTDKNIFGILDSQNSRTPQFYSIASKDGISSLESSMLINNDILDTSKDNTNIPSLDNVLRFINLVEYPYVVDELPDIFTSSINSNELSLLWNLDKDNYSYAFQNSFFYDYEWNDNSEPTHIKWRLSFEKNALKGNEGNKDEIVMFLDIKKEASSYKIDSIQKQK
ncbi:MAG: hypothetical protein E7208_04160 [Clostridium butyricum]|nr:hypothetical protein [Clostridium butyricum]